MTSEEEEDSCPICYEDFEHNDVDDLEATRTARLSARASKERIAIATSYHHLDDVNNNKSNTSCQHAFCRACLRDYCQHAILMRQIPIPCPARQVAVRQTSTSRGRGSCSNNKRSKSKDAAASTVSSSSSSIRVGGCPAVLSDALVQEVLRESQPEESVMGGDNLNVGERDDQEDGSSSSKKVNENPYWIKFQRFLKLAKDPSLVACPLCNELVAAQDDQQQPDNVDDEDEEMGQQREQTTRPKEQPEQPLASSSSSSSSWSTLRRYCSDCQLEFCAQHGHLLHAPHAAACAAYTQRLQLQQQEQQQDKNNRNHQQQTEQTLRSYTKPCSHCGCRLQKFAGCDHVVCPACQQDMCFACGTHVYLSSPPIKGGRHSGGGQQQQQQVDSMFRHCAKCKQGFVDHRYAHRYRCRMLLYLPLYLPFMILYTVIVGAVLLPLTGLFCCCFACGTCVDDEPLAPPPRTPPPQAPRQQRHQQRQRQEGRREQYEEQPTERAPVDPMRGILLACCIIFLPFLLVLHDFGWESDFVDHFMTQQQHNNNNNNNNRSSTSSSQFQVIGVSEIPTMELEADDALANDNDDDDVSGIVELVDSRDFDDVP